MVFYILIIGGLVFFIVGIFKRADYMRNIGVMIMGVAVIYSLATGIAEAKQAAPYYEHPDKFCEEYDMGYKFGDCFFCEDHYYCTEFTNDVIILHEISKGGGRWGFIDYPFANEEVSK